MSTRDFDTFSLERSSSKSGTVEGLLNIDPSTFGSNFDRKPFIIRHHLVDHPFFSLPCLLDLAMRLPKDHIECHAGDVPPGSAPTLTPPTELSIEETIRRIGESRRNWLLMKNVEYDPEYRALLHQCLAEIRSCSEVIFKGMMLLEAFIFVTSPESVTPCHLDHEHNFLLQIQGPKTINTFDRSDRSILSEEFLEACYSGGPRYVPVRKEYLKRAAVFDLAPGMGLHIPVSTPHWVKNGDQVSVSFSITFRNEQSERRGIIYDANARLRRLGFSPVPFGRSSLRDSAKFYGYRLLRKAGMLREQQNRQEKRYGR